MSAIRLTTRAGKGEESLAEMDLRTLIGWIISRAFLAISMVFSSDDVVPQMGSMNEMGRKLRVEPTAS